MDTSDQARLELGRLDALWSTGYLTDEEYQAQHDVIVELAGDGDLTDADLYAGALTELAQLVAQGELSRDEFELRKATMIWAEEHIPPRPRSRPSRCGRARSLMLAGVWIGLAFQAKMLQSVARRAGTVPHLPRRRTREPSPPPRPRRPRDRGHRRGLAQLD